MHSGVSECSSCLPRPPGELAFLELLVKVGRDNVKLNIEVEEGFDAAEETIEVVEMDSEILIVVGSLPFLSDVVELIERLDVENVIHALRAFQIHELVGALVKIESLVVALLVRELHHVVGFIVRILPQFLDFIKLHRHGHRHFSRLQP